MKGPYTEQLSLNQLNQEATKMAPLEVRGIENGDWLLMCIPMISWPPIIDSILSLGMNLASQKDF